MFDFGCSEPIPECDSIQDPCGVGRDEFICQALKLLPKGDLWERRECNFSQFFAAIASTYYDQFQQMCALRIEANPCTADNLLSEWASIWGGLCEALPDDPQALRDVLCSFLSQRGILTCELITEQLAAQGYNVISCAMDETKSTELVTPTCGPTLGHGGSLGCYPVPMTDSCASDLAGLPCAAVCCEQAETPDLVVPDPCNIVANTGTCSTCSSEMSGLGVFQSAPSYFPLLNPSTLVVTIDQNSPSIDPCYIPPLSVGVGLSLGVNCFTQIRQSACAIEAVRPAHLNIVYRLDC